MNFTEFLKKNYSILPNFPSPHPTPPPPLPRAVPDLKDCGLLAAFKGITRACNLLMVIQLKISEPKKYTDGMLFFSGRTIRKVMGGGGGIFSLHEFFFYAHCLCRIFFFR